MLDQIALLHELQELEIVLKEAAIVHQEDGKADSVRKKVEGLRNRIEAMILARYDRLANHGLAVVGLQDDRCLGCNISIAMGDLQRMRKEMIEPVCPHCGKFLVL